MRVNAVTRIVNSANGLGISVTSDDVLAKMHGLCVYYSATRSKAIASQRKSGFGVDDVLKVKWPYHEKLFF